MKFLHFVTVILISLCLSFFCGSRVSGGLDSKRPQAFKITPPPQQHLHYLNIPETVKTAGILGDFKMASRIKSRVFFHFKNDTGSTQVFKLQVMGSPVIYRQLGIALSRDPGVAGSLATQKFLEFVPEKDPQYTTIRTSVPQGVTISGVFDAMPIAESGSRVLVSMGDEATNYYNWTVLKSKYGFIPKTVHLDKNDKFVVRMGDAPRMENRILGDYGSTVKIRITNVSGVKQRIRIAISPRGGPAMFVYKLKGKVKRTTLVPYGAEVEISSSLLSPLSAIEIVTMPSGGWCYPMEIRISSHSV